MGAAPETFVLDNETSRELTSAVENEKITYQSVVPCKHRNNQAERAMKNPKATSNQDEKEPI